MWDPTEETMREMLARLAHLKEVRQDLANMGCAGGMLKMADSEISQQRGCLQKALRIHPELKAAIPLDILPEVESWTPATTV